ncbi:MAG: TraB/GumN family protein [Syntrophobacterales bacterium]|nr:MAG: TraB/GumN family protein [Syntrophobacterales bacterium]
MAIHQTLKRNCSRALSVIISLALICAAASTVILRQSLAKDTGKSCLWSLQTKSSAIYLLGSLHLLKLDAYPLKSAIERAYAASQKIVFETDIAAMKGPVIQAKILELGLYPEGQNLYHNLNGSTRRVLEKKLSDLSLPLEHLAMFKPWAVALTLASLELQRLGFDPNYGVDIYFFKRAKKDVREMGFLEPPEYQLNLLAKMNKQDQNSFLRQTLRDLNLVLKLAGDMVSYWKTGDADGLHDLFFKSFKDYPNIHDRLLIQRNKKWILKIENLIRENKNVLVIVGAGHLVGPDGLIDLLEKKGYTLKQR